MLEIRNLTKVYGKKTAVDHLSVHVRPGDIYGFIGHNGAGKTTTLKSCVGILDIDEGEIFIDGESLTNKPVLCKQKLAFVPDNPVLEEYLTGIQYLNFVCDLYRMDGKKRRERIDELAEKFELRDSLGALVSSYSHGMKQKLALIGAFVHEPKLMIMDEPFVGLDPQAFYTLKELMRQLCDQGSAILFSSHVLDVVEKLCNRLAIIRSGKLVADGDLQDIIGNESLENVFLELSEHEDHQSFN